MTISSTIEQVHSQSDLAVETRLFGSSMVPNIIIIIIIIISAVFTTRMVVKL